MPGQIGIIVGGTPVVRPSVNVNIDASALTPFGVNPLGTVGFVGAADGGVPGVAYTFTSFQDAAKVMRSGEALSLMGRIFSPSSEEPGAGKVIWTRLGAPIQSTLAASGMTFTSVDYGRHTTGLSVQIAVGSTSPWTVTVRKRLDGVQETFNVGLGLSVTSTNPNSQIVFDHAAKQMKVYQGSVQAIFATLDYPNDSVTLANAASFLQGLAGWTAVVAGDPTMPLRFMDNPVLGSAPSITSSATALPASQGQLQWKLLNDPYLTAALTTGTTFGPLSVVAETYLASGTGTALDTFSSSDWTNALTVMETQDIEFLFLDTTNPTYVALGYQHVLNMRTVKQKRFRILITGSPAAQTAADAAAVPATIPGPAVYVWDGTLVANPLTGINEQLGGLGAAAQVCGVASGSNPGDPVTGKHILGSAVEFPNATDTDISSLLVAGVTPITLDVSTGQPTIEQGLTTYQGGANVAFRKLQGLRIQDAISRGFQAILNPFRGRAMDLIQANLIKVQVQKFLDSVTKTAHNPAGYLTPGLINGQPVPAWDNLSISGDGLEVWTIDVDVHPVGEGDYINVNVQLTPAPISI